MDLDQNQQNNDFDGNDGQEVENIPYFEQGNFESTWALAIERGLPQEDPINVPGPEFFGLTAEDPVYTAMVENYFYFRTHYILNLEHQNIYVFRIELYKPLILNLLRHWLRVTYLNENAPFKLNFSFSFLLRRMFVDPEDEEEDESEIRVFIANTNSFCYFSEEPPLITNQNDLDNILDLLDENDLLEQCSLQRANTKFIFESFLSVVISATKIPNYTIGNDNITYRDIPDYIKRNRWVHTLLYDHSRPKKNSQLCIFRCLSCHKSQTYENYETDAKRLCKSYIEFLNNLDIDRKPKRIANKILSVQNFPGVTLDELVLIEKCFLVDVCVYSLFSKDEKKQYFSKGRKRKNTKPSCGQRRAKRRKRNAFILDEAIETDGDNESDIESENTNYSACIDDNENQEEEIEQQDDADDEQEIETEENSNDIDDEIEENENEDDEETERETEIDQELDPKTPTTDTRAKVVRYSSKTYPETPTLNLLLFKQHFCLIKDVNRFANRFQCQACSKLFPSVKLMNQHLRHYKNKEKSCRKNTCERKFVGGSMGRALTVWDRLRIKADIYVPQHLRFYPYFLCYDLETYCPDRPTPGTDSDRYRSNDEETENNDMTELLLSPSYRPIEWLDDHEIANRIPENLNDSLSQFLFEEWTRFRADRSNHARWRVRFCKPPFDEIDKENWKRINASEREDKTFRRSIDYRQIREIVLRGLSIISRERRCSVKVNFRPLLCVKYENPDFEYKLKKSRKYFFPLAFDLSDFRTAIDELRRLALPESDFELAWTSFLNDSIPKNYLLVGILAFEFVFDFKRLEYLYGLTPLSAVAAGNFENFRESKFICMPPDEDDGQRGAKNLIEELVDYFYDAAISAEKKMRRRFAKYLVDLKRKKRFFRERQLPYESALRDAKRTLCRRGEKKPSQKRICQLAEVNLVNSTRIHFGKEKPTWTNQDIQDFKEDKRTYIGLCKLTDEFDAYLRELPILGYNSSSFDIQVSRHLLFPSILRRDNAGTRDRRYWRPLKCYVRAQRYLAVFTKRFVLTDAEFFQMMYTAPMSYESFLRSWEVKTNKLRWCYDYVRHPSQLEETSLPPREAWANWLRKEREPSEIEYRELQNFWRERRYANLRQFLAEYNAADVQGLIEAIRKMKLFWKSYNLDALKSAISLPGLAFESMLLYLHKEAPYTILQTMNSANADLFDCLRENLVAGAAIVFDRYCERDVTCAPNGEKIQTIFSSLYPSMGCDFMPVNVGVRYRAKIETKSNVSKVDDNDDNRNIPIQHDSTTTNVNDDDYDDNDDNILSERERSVNDEVASSAASTSRLGLTTDSFTSDIRSNNTPSTNIDSSARTISVEMTDDQSNATTFNDKTNDDDDWRHRTFHAEQTEKYWRASTEWLYVTLDKLRTSEQCLHHEMLGKYYNGLECRFTARSIPVDAYCTHCGIAFQFMGCYWHGHSIEECLDPNTKSRFAALNEDQKEKWRQRRRETDRIANYFKQDLIGPKEIISIWACEWALERKDPSVRRFVLDRFPYFNLAPRLSGQKLLEKVLEGRFTGFITVDIRVKSDQRDRFNECPPIYFHRVISRQELRSPMKEYVEKEGLLKRAQKLLVSDLRAQKITLLTTYVRHLINECSCEVTRVYEACYFQLAPVLRGFFGMILDKRQKAQKIRNTALSNALKLKANSIYGRACIQRENHRNTIITTVERVQRALSDPRFRELTILQPNEFYQISKRKKRISMRILVQIAKSILDLSKIELNSFVHKFVRVYFENRMVILQCDTDSWFLGGCRNTLDAHVRPELMEKYLQAKETTLAIRADQKFTPRLWKVECANGTCYIGTSSKTYYMEIEEPNDDEARGGTTTTIKKNYWKCKGVQHKINNLKKSQYLSAVFDQTTTRIENRGFRLDKHKTNRVHSYRVQKRAVNFSYLKRHVRENCHETDSLTYFDDQFDNGTGDSSNVHSPTPATEQQN